MYTYISLLKGINVGGHHKIPMEDLKSLYQNLGFQNVVTYIQSGNVIFSSKGSSAEKEAQKIKKGIQDKFGFEIEVIIRTTNELKQIINTNPYPDAEGNKSYVTFLAGVPAEIPSEIINKIKAPSESYVVTGREVYVHCPDGYGKTKLANDFFEKKLKVAATSRNWNTVRILSEMAEKHKGSL